jgi:hypothetical protein
MSKINLHEMMKEQMKASYQIELAKAEKCCGSCRDIMLESHIYFEYGYTAALTDLQGKVDVTLSIADEALLWCEEMLKARDEMNSKVHCAPVRLSPITERVMQARQALAEFKNGVEK